MTLVGSWMHDEVVLTLRDDAVATLHSGILSPASSACLHFDIWFGTELLWWTSADGLVSLDLDCRVRESAHGGCLHSSAIASHPREHGAEQPNSVPEDSGGDHCGTAHLSPPGVSIHPPRVERSKTKLRYIKLF